MIAVCIFIFSDISISGVSCCRLTTVSTASTPDDSSAYHSSSANQCSSDLHNKRSVTVPSSLADSAVSLSSVESSTTLSSDDRNSKLHQVLHDTRPCGHTLASDSSLAKDKKKKLGLSRLLRGKQKDL